MLSYRNNGPERDNKPIINGEQQSTNGRTPDEFWSLSRDAKDALNRMALMLDASDPLRSACRDLAAAIRLRLATLGPPESPQ